MAEDKRALILLVRHGRAEDGHPLGDGARALTAEGRQIFRAHAALVAARVSLKGIVTSPLVRAVQTAEILAEAAHIADIVVVRDLDFDVASPSRLEALARARGPGWALVGHNPSLGETLPHLLGLSSEAVRFRKGAVAALEPSRTGALPWRLAWLAEPQRKLKHTLESEHD